MRVLQHVIVFTLTVGFSYAGWFSCDCKLHQLEHCRRQKNQLENTLGDIRKHHDDEKRTLQNDKETERNKAYQERIDAMKETFDDYKTLNQKREKAVKQGIKATIKMEYEKKDKERLQKNQTTLIEILVIVSAVLLIFIIVGFYLYGQQRERNVNLQSRLTEALEQTNRERLMHVNNPIQAIRHSVMETGYVQNDSIPVMFLNDSMLSPQKTLVMAALSKDNINAHACEVSEYMNQPFAVFVIPKRDRYLVLKMRSAIKMCSLIQGIDQLVNEVKTYRNKNK
ncbi:uncharacterized protein LOC141904214 [Tubulanus polymorphus]|uniref:uncharacterized protein LOC141904214 n=1 Tax=Tubulanus polymorphus TaxID=672921 RepID=UPI003DA20EA4